MKLFSSQEHESAMTQIRTSPLSNSSSKLSIGVKKLIMMIEMARQDVDKVDKFVGTLLACFDLLVGVGTL